MAKRAIIVAVVLMLISLLIFTGCSQVTGEPIPTTAVPTTPVLTTDTAPADYSGLGLTDTEIRLLNERGIASVDAAEVASAIAGFKVFEPSFVPEGYTGGKFMIQLSGAGLPEGMKPKFNNTTVERIYTYRQDPTKVIDLIQQVHQTGIGGAAPTTLCGKTAERLLTPASADGKMSGDKLSLGWEVEGDYFTITGWLNESLDETQLAKMACSIKNS
jgi:hypothetical protein